MILFSRIHSTILFLMFLRIRIVPVRCQFLRSHSNTILPPMRLVDVCFWVLFPFPSRCSILNGQMILAAVGEQNHVLLVDKRMRRSEQCLSRNGVGHDVFNRLKFNIIVKGKIATRLVEILLRIVRIESINHKLVLHIRLKIQLYCTH